MRADFQGAVIVCALTTIAVSVAATSFAETVIGAKVGLAQSRIEVGGWKDPEWHSGIAVGPFLSVYVGEHLAIQSSVIYTQRGGSYGKQGSLPDGSLQSVEGASYTVDLIEFPLLFRYRPGSGTGPLLVLIAGPVWQAPVSSEFIWDGESMGEWAESSGFVLALGGGVESNFGRLAGCAEVLYRWSLSAIGDTESFTKDASLDGFNLQVGVGF